MAPKDKVNEIKKLVKKHYWFLVEKYNFVFDDREYTSSEYDFHSPEIWIQIKVGRQAPSVIIRRIGEPDDIYELLNGVMQYLGHEYPGIRFFENSLEDNIQTAAKRFEEVAPKIIDTIDDWWIPVRFHYYKIAEEEYKSNDQYEDFLVAFKKTREYLKRKGGLKQ